MNEFIIEISDNLKMNGYDIDDGILFQAIRHCLHHHLKTREDFIVELCAYLVAKNSDVLMEGTLGDLCNIVENASKNYATISTEEGVAFVRDSVANKIVEEASKGFWKEVERQENEKNLLAVEEASKQIPKL